MTRFASASHVRAHERQASAHHVLLLLSSSATFRQSINTSLAALTEMVVLGETTERFFPISS